MLFKHLVLNKLGIYDGKFDWLAEPSKKLLIESRTDKLPLMINRDGQSQHWDSPISEVAKGELELEFIDYFDWDEYDQVDFRYFRAKISDSVKFKDLIGFDVLVETIYADVYYIESS